MYSAIYVDEKSPLQKPRKMIVQEDETTRKMFYFYCAHYGTLKVYGSVRNRVVERLSNIGKNA